MPLATIIAGRYSGTWNALSTGLAKDDGYRLIEEPKEQAINRSDAFAQTLIETIYQGVDWSVVFTMIEYNAGAVSTVISPWAALGLLGVIAQLGSALAKPFVLTSTVGTPAAASPATLTATLAKLAPNTNTEIGFGPNGREVPVRLQFLPALVSTVIQHFATT